MCAPFPCVRVCDLFGYEEALIRAKASNQRFLYQRFPLKLLLLLLLHAANDNACRARNI